MTVDAHVTRTGIMTESSMTSGWKVSGRAAMDQNQHITVSVDAPYQENSIFRFNHKLMKISGDENTQMALSGPETVQNDCSAEYLGHALCVDTVSWEEILSDYLEA